MFSTPVLSACIFTASFLLKPGARALLADMHVGAFGNDSIPQCLSEFNDNYEMQAACVNVSGQCDL